MRVDSQCVEQTQLVAVCEVVHEDATSVGHLSVAPDYAVQESLRGTAQEGARQALRGAVRETPKGAERLRGACSTGRWKALLMGSSWGWRAKWVLGVQEAD